MADRDIDRREAELTLDAPELTLREEGERRIHMRRYVDSLLGQTMLLRVVVEETSTEIVVVTLYKTSRIARYLGGPVQ